GIPISAPGARRTDPRELAYMAPERLRGSRPNVRGDIYALGVILWELVSGQRLFGMNTEVETRAKLDLREVPLLRRMSLGCPDRVGKIVARALALDPMKRFGSARDLGQALQAALVSEALVVTDDDVGRSMLKLFGDLFEEREERLRSAQEVTEVFR